MTNKVHNLTLDNYKVFSLDDVKVFDKVILFGGYALSRLEDGRFHILIDNDPSFIISENFAKTYIEELYKQEQNKNRIKGTQGNDK
ncbi:hypothetical protein [Effusibacillus lacus]|uniref:hypothetical protein n=1 Tax=Effusibacillus lacus TaxID=1348429 RepID=UPI000BB6929D|nr:hypothetical protein [Effusibacillus lacus]TCS66826.1 hypothetical protein EDD64_1542 [Effusibacillus lacus]